MKNDRVKLLKKLVEESDNFLEDNEIFHKINEFDGIITDIMDDLETCASNLEERFPSRSEEMMEKHQEYDDLLTELNDLKENFKEELGGIINSLSSIEKQQ